MITKTTFDRSLTATLKQQMIEAAAQPGWWQDVMQDRDLVVALRGAYANVYYHGQSLFKVSAGANGLRASTHEKYLLDPKLGGQIAFDGEAFAIEALKNKAFLATYDEKSLARIKKAAQIYAGDEKIGCHIAAVNSPEVIDVEIALSGSIEHEDEPGRDVQTPRIDLLSLRTIKGRERAAELVFWEAKAFKNTELGSARVGAKLETIDASHSPVLAQIENYRLMLESYRAEIVASYRRVCEDRYDVFAAADALGRIGPLVRGVSGREGAAYDLVLADPPRVNLLVFGFDEPQKVAWKPFREKLEAALAPATLRAVGDPTGARL